MLIEAQASDLALLSAGIAPRDLASTPEGAIAPPATLQMLADLAATIEPRFAPAAWLIVEGGEAVGLLSLVHAPADGELQIGYGVAPLRHGRGIAGRALAEFVEWAMQDPRVQRLTAETSVDNPASQRVLQRNGFVVTGSRQDAEDGPLLCWERRISHVES